MTDSIENGTSKFEARHFSRGKSVPLGLGAFDSSVFVTRQGVAVSQLASDGASDKTHRVFLPLSDAADQMLSQPPLGLALTYIEANDLIADVQRSRGHSAATNFGSVLQSDKFSNQDFALSGCIKLHGNDTDQFLFAAIADGVTSLTFWPERSSRIAVLTAWRAVRSHLTKGLRFSGAEISTLASDMASDLRRALQHDREALLSVSPRIIPEGWLSSLYESRISRDSLWYNTTLTIVVLSDDGGAILYCGDGGIILRKTIDNITKSHVLLSSDVNDTTVSNVVSISNNKIPFNAASISINNISRLEVIVTTDGFDRLIRRVSGTVNGTDDPYGDILSGAVDSKRLHNIMMDIYESNAPHDGIEIDNISVVRLCWPDFPNNIARRLEVKTDLASIDKSKLFSDFIQRNSNKNPDSFLHEVYITLIIIVLQLFELYVYSGKSQSLYSYDGFDDFENRHKSIYGDRSRSIIKIVLVYYINKVTGNISETRKFFANKIEHEAIIDNIIANFAPLDSLETIRISDFEDRTFDIARRELMRLILRMRQTEIERFKRLFRTLYEGP